MSLKNFLDLQRKLDGHTGDVYSIRLFPSGIVILSSGADMRTKIWSAEDGSCPVTFTGHTAAVTHTGQSLSEHEFNLNP